MFGTEFWAGVVLGGVAGVPAGLAVTQVQTWWDRRALRKLRSVERKASSRLESHASSGAWRLGKLTAKIHVFEVVLEGYKPQHFEMRLSTETHSDVSTVRTALASTKILENEGLLALKTFDERVDYWAACGRGEVQNAPTVYDNHDLVVLDRFSFGRLANKDSGLEEQSFQCSVQSGSYTAHRAAVDVFASLSKSLKNGICRLEREKLPFFGLNTAVSIALVSSDHRLIFGQRRNLAVDPGRIVCGIGEGLRTEDVRGNAFDFPGPWQAAVRGLEEEFGLKLPSRDRLKITAVCRSEEFYEFYFLGLIDLRDSGLGYTVGSIRAKLSEAAMTDKYETLDILDCELTADGLSRFLASHRSIITEYGKVAACLALLTIDPRQRNALELALDQAFV